MEEEKGKGKEAGESSSGQEPNKLSLPDVLPPEIMKQLPKELQDKVRESLTMSMTMMEGSIPRPFPLADKITSEHVGKIIDHVENESIRDSKQRGSDRWFILVGFLVVVAFFAGMSYLFRNSTELMMNMIIALVSLVGGFGAGYGFAGFRHKE